MSAEPLIIHIALRPLSAGLLTDPDFPQVLLADQQALARHPQRRNEQLLSRTWRRHILATWLAQPPQDLYFAADCNGKPYLQQTLALAPSPQPASVLEFSQSHCQGCFILAFNQQGIAIGVDIEDRQRPANLAGLAKRILTPAEQQHWAQASNPDDALLQYWTIKEAVLKACGLGIRLNMNMLETQIHQAANTAYHPEIGLWSYHCFASAQHFYTVAWKKMPQQTVEFCFLDSPAWVSSQDGAQIP